MRQTFFIALLLNLLGAPLARAGSIPAGKTPYVVFLAAIPDAGLVGKRVDVIARIMTNHSAVSLEKVVVSNVLLVSAQDNEWAAADRNVTLAVSPQEQKKLDKASAQVGVDLLVVPH